MRVLSREEMQRFLNQAKEDGYYELFLLELFTGLRRGELPALQWDDLDFQTGELQSTKRAFRIQGKLLISEPKASVPTAILPPSIVDMLREYQKSLDTRWMFPSPKKVDAPLDFATVRKSLCKILEHAQRKKVRFHDLRHTFATTAPEYGTDGNTLSAVIGHISPVTTLNIYAHITDTIRKAAAL